MLPANTRARDRDRIARARKLRSEASVSEQWLWSFLRKKRLGVKFRRQHAVGKYTLDFYCPEKKLCIEVDGEQHFETLEADKFRDSELALLGIRVIRTPSLDLFEDNGHARDAWLKVIAEACE
ncbi:MAG TPA: endonuclease domain-containing protein [Fimbriimonadaceae bacterium]|jgi:very-short-patch-repair endonuclease